MTRSHGPSSIGFGLSAKEKTRTTGAKTAIRVVMLPTTTGSLPVGFRPLRTWWPIAPRAGRSPFWPRWWPVAPCAGGRAGRRPTKPRPWRAHAPEAVLLLLGQDLVQSVPDVPLQVGDLPLLLRREFQLGPKAG